MQNVKLTKMMVEAKKGANVSDCILECVALSNADACEVELIHDQRSYTILTTDAREVLTEITKRAMQ